MQHDGVKMTITNQDLIDKIIELRKQNKTIGDIADEINWPERKSYVDIQEVISTISKNGWRTIQSTDNNRTTDLSWCRGAPHFG